MIEKLEVFQINKDPVCLQFSFNPPDEDETVCETIEECISGQLPIEARMAMALLNKLSNVHQWQLDYARNVENQMALSVYLKKG